MLALLGQPKSQIHMPMYGNRKKRKLIQYYIGSLHNILLSYPLHVNTHNNEIS
jgi:hypothetical protein